MVNVKTESAPRCTEVTTESTQLPRPDFFTLAHVSDLHLTSLNNAKVSDLLSKRMLGYFSWRRKRRIVHRRDILDALLADLLITCPDHVAVTGDLTHIGLPDEFTEAAQWLPSLGAPERVTVIPGNHEAYAGNRWIKELAKWAPYLGSDASPSGPLTADFFPSLRVRGQVALIGLCSARPSLPFLAVGSLGQAQLKSLASLLDKTGAAGFLRVILVHHPPVRETINWRKRLVDSKPFADVLARHGAELILHGHAHVPVHSGLSTPAGIVPVLGAPSASELSPRKGRCAKYNLYRMSRVGQRCEITICVRGYSEALGRFVAESETVIAVPQPGSTADPFKHASPESAHRPSSGIRVKPDSC